MAQAQVQEYHQREMGSITMESLQAGTMLQEQEPRGSNRWIASERRMTLSLRIQTLFQGSARDHSHFCTIVKCNRQHGGSGGSGQQPSGGAHGRMVKTPRCGVTFDLVPRPETSAQRSYPSGVGCCWLNHSVQRGTHLVTCCVVGCHGRGNLLQCNKSSLVQVWLHSSQQYESSLCHRDRKSNVSQTCGRLFQCRKLAQAWFSADLLFLSFLLRSKCHLDSFLELYDEVS